MPHTVTSLFRAVDLEPSGVIPWGTPPTCREKGIYIVALGADPSSLVGTIRTLPASQDAISTWMSENQVLIDGAPASFDALCTRLGRYWLPDEVVLYIGKSEKEDGVCGRVRQFYSHKLGQSRPHSGGQWIKTLTELPRLFIHYSRCSDPVAVESAMIGRFCSNAPTGPFPFANLEWRKGGRRYIRKHGIHSSATTARNLAS